MNKKYAVIITTHNRILDAKISMEIIRYFWSKVNDFSSIDIFHVYDGRKEWYKKKYLEDFLIRRNNIDHYLGAANLIDTGINKVLKSNINYKYIIVLSADVLIIKPKRLRELLSMMDKNKYLLLTSIWPSFAFIPKYFATEFFIISTPFAKKVFPLNLPHFFKRRRLDNLLYEISKFVPVLTVPKVELCFTQKVLKTLNSSFWDFKWLKFIYLIPERKFVWIVNRHRSKKLGYYSYHDLFKKINLISSEASIKHIVKRAVNLKKVIKTNVNRKVFS